LMGHDLEVKSRPGHGTVFRILVAPTQLADMENMVLGAETVPGLVEVNRTALVIDDEESIRIGMRDLMRAWGFEVLLASGIAQACAEVRRHGGVIDVIISDLRLADGEDGIDAVERVRAAYGGPVPAVLITGDTSAGEVMRIHASGFQVLFKPVRPRDLHLLLRSLA
jgi:two-component system, sensor histidine kinase